MKNFNFSGIAHFYKGALRTVVFCSLLFVLQRCAHYVADVPIASVQVRPVMPYAGGVWIDGGWGWRGGRHTQLAGHWERPGGRAWQEGEWRQSARGHYWVRGHRR